jgi:hypothetical protein
MIFKNYLRSIMKQKMLPNISNISIEPQLCENINTKSLIINFTRMICLF